MPKPNRNGRTSKNKDRAARHASQQPSSQPTSQPPSQPASEQSSRQHSQQPSPLPTPSTGQRQLPTPLPEVDLRPHGGHSVMAHEYQHGVEDEYRHGLQHDEYTANLHHPPAAHSSSSSSETPPPESPPTISVDEGHGGGGGMLPPLSSSPGVDALIDFGVSPGTVGTTQDATATTVHAKGYGYAGGEGYGAHDIVDFGDDVAGMGLGLALEGTAYSGGSYEHQHDHRTTPCEHDNRNIAYGDDHDAEDEAYKSKSPPFRQAAELPDLEEDEEGLGGVAMGGGEGRGGGETSLSPLPTRPRLLDDDDYREGGEGEREERGYGELGYGYGHTREPVIPSRTLSHTSSRSSRSPPPVGSRSSNPSSGTPVSTTASSTRGSTSQAERTRSPSVPSTRSPSAPRTRSPIPAAVSATRSKSPISPSSLTRTIRSLAPGVVGSFAGKEERTYNREERRRGDERASLEGRKRREEDYADPEDRKVDRGGGYGGVDRGEGYDDGEGEYEYHPFSYGSPPVRQSGLPPRTIVPERQKSWKETETAQRRRKASPSPHSHSHRERERGRERGYDYDEEEEEDAYDERGEERTRREARGTGRERGLGRERERERNDTLKAASATSGLSQTLRQERRNLDDDAYSIAAANAPTAAREVNTFTSGRDINASTTTAARDRDDARRRVGRSSAGGSSGGGADTVLWAKWDKSGVGVGGRRRRLLLILAYANGLQIWDTSNLGSVKEVLNVNFEPETLARLGFVDEEAHESEKEVRAVDAQIVPTPLGKTKKDVWEGERPLLGILLNSTDREGETSTTFALYSLKNHRVVEKTGLVGVGERVECSSAGFVAVSTTSPPSIHILSSTSLETLYTVPSSSLALFAHPPAGHRTSTYLPSTSNLAESILSATQTQPFATPGPVGRTTSATAQGAKKPVFSLSGRLLAFAVPSTTNEGVGDKRRGVGGGDVGGGGGGSGGVGGEGRGGGSPSSVGSGTGFSFGLSNLSNISEIGKNVSELGRNVVQGRIPTSQAELGSAALKVGGSVLSGMRFLGGKAVEAVAKRSVSGGGGFGGGDASPAGSSPVMTSRGVGPGAGGVGAGGVGMGGVGGGRVSRSAPTDLGFGEGLGGQSEEKARRRLSGLSSVSPDSNGFGGGVSPLTKGRVERGSVVRVVDLGTLVDVNGNAKKELAAAKSSTTARTSAANKTSPTTTNKSSTTTKAPSTTKTPKVVVDFIGSRSQTIAHIAFSTDGGTLFVVPRDGQVTKVFKVVPGPPVPSGLRGARVGEEGVQSSTSPGRAQYASQSPPHGQGSYQDRTQGAYQDRPLGTAIHLYDLRRGVSSAVIEDIEVLPDGLLAGVTTRNRTVHVFASNPFGGRTDVGAHLSGRVRDYVGGLNPPLKVQLSPIVRVRGSRLGNQDGTGDGPREYAALAFTFVQSNDGVVLPPSLNARPRSLHLDSASSTAPLSSSPSATSYTSNYHLASARHSRPNANHQDTLLFDPVEGTLYLQRITLEARVVKSKEGGASFGIAGTSLGSVSTSLTSGFVAGASLTGGFAAGMGMSSLGSRGSVPGAGAAGPLSRSGGGSSGVSASVSERSGVSGASRGAGGGGVRDDQFELVAGVNVVATWNLQRGKEWDEIFVPMHVEREGGRGRGGGGGRGEEWISQAELSTFSPSRAVLPRPIYLSHQFSFHNLGEDYHALIRGYRFDIAGTKIDVRRDVPVQAFSTSISSQGTTDVFLDDFAASSPTSPGGRGTGRMGVVSSFDEPLASALAGEMEGGVVLSESVLPMYPNGVPGSRRGGKIIGIPGIPIKGFGDGVSEGLGRIRRGIRKHGAKIHGRYRDGSATGEGVGAPGEMAFEYDEEEDEEFMAPRIRHSASSRSHTHTPTNQRSLAGSIHSNMDMDDDVVGHVDEEIWGEGGWDKQDRQAIEDAEGFVGISKTVSVHPGHGGGGHAYEVPSGSGTASGRGSGGMGGGGGGSMTGEGLVSATSPLSVVTPLPKSQAVRSRKKSAGKGGKRK